MCEESQRQLNSRWVACTLLNGFSEKQAEHVLAAAANERKLVKCWQEGELETYNNVLEEWNLVLNAGDMYISAAAAGESDRRIDMSMATLHAVDTKLAVKGGPTLRTKK